MAKSPEVHHLEKAVIAAQKVIAHAPTIIIEPEQTEAETTERLPEAE